MEPAHSPDNGEARADSGEATRRSGGQIALLVAGSIVTLLALAVLAAGGLLIAINETERDSAGFFSTADETYTSDGYAIVSDELDVGTDGPDWLFREGRLATLRLRGSSQEAGSEFFIGIGPTAQVKDYLAGSSYDLVTDVNFDPFRVTYRSSPGDSAPTEPADESFWAVSARGSGSQSVEWEIAEGNWSVVVMNADASPGVDARLSLGAKVGFIFGLGLGLVIAGAILLAGGAAMIYFGARRRTPTAPTATPAASGP